METRLPVEGSALVETRHQVVNHLLVEIDCLVEDWKQEKTVPLVMYLIQLKADCLV